MILIGEWIQHNMISSIKIHAAKNFSGGQRTSPLMSFAPTMMLPLGRGREGRGDVFQSIWRRLGSVAQKISQFNIIIPEEIRNIKKSNIA